MNSIQIEMCAQMILEKMWMYSLEDVQIALDNGSCGFYGPIFNKLDPSVVFEWLGKYEQERNRAIAEKRKREVEQHNIYEVFQNPTMIDALRTVTAAMDQRKPAIVNEPIRKPSPFEAQIMAEWDAIPYEKGTMLKHCFELLMDFTDYRKWRYSEEMDKLQENETP